MKAIPIEKLSVRWTGPVDPETGNQEDNPNKMTVEQFSALKQLIKRHGFLQPVLHTKKLVIIDGAHRYYAARAVGLAEILGVLKDAKKYTAGAIGIGMNRIRGELELSATSHLMKEIIEGTKWSPEQLSTMTGFSSDEVQAMIEDVLIDGEEIIEEAAAAQEEADRDEEEIKIHEVGPFEYKNKDVVKRIKKKLKKAGQGDMSQGLLHVLGETEE